MNRKITRSRGEMFAIFKALHHPSSMTRALVETKGLGASCVLVNKAADVSRDAKIHDISQETLNSIWK